MSRPVPVVSGFAHEPVFAPNFAGRRWLYFLRNPRIGWWWILKRPGKVEYW